MQQQKNIQIQNIFGMSKSQLSEAQISRKSYQMPKLRKQRGSNPSIFISKTFEILQNEEYSDIIKWNPEGTTFIIEDIEKFEEEVLPIFFRHRNYTSFVRQLNMYDFHKIRNQANRNIFEHKEFRRHSRQSLKNIKRKGCTTGRKFESEDPLVQNNENEEPERILSHKTVGNIGVSKATVQNSQTYIQKIFSPKYQENYRHHYVQPDNNSPMKKKMIQEFISDLPEVVNDESQIQDIIRDLKKNPRYSCLNSKRELKHIVKKIKYLKLRKFQGPHHLDDLSIEEEIIIDNAEPRSIRNLSLAIFDTEKYLPMKSISVIGSLHFLEEADNLLYPH